MVSTYYCRFVTSRMVRRVLAPSRKMAILAFAEAEGVPVTSYIKCHSSIPSGCICIN